MKEKKGCMPLNKTHHYFLQYSLRLPLPTTVPWTLNTDENHDRHFFFPAELQGNQKLCEYFHLWLWTPGKSMAKNLKDRPRPWWTMYGQPDPGEEALCLRGWYLGRPCAKESLHYMSLRISGPKVLWTSWSIGQMSVLTFCSTKYSASCFYSSSTPQFQESIISQRKLREIFIVSAKLLYAVVITCDLCWFEAGVILTLLTMCRTHDGGVDTKTNDMIVKRRRMSA